MTEKRSVADPFGLDDVCEDGLYLVGSDKPVEIDYDVREWCRYVEEKGIKKITKEVVDQAKKDGVLSEHSFYWITEKEED